MFIKAKKKRSELRLPILHYIVADDWMDKLGPKAFTAWLKFHTWVNRQDEEIDDINYAKIPMSIEKVAEKLEVNKSTLYRTILPVLWEYGLIDLIEYEKSTRKTQKPVNIIPYDYPQNDKSLEVKPLEKCRDWKKDYNTTATFYGRQGGRNSAIKPFQDGCENATVDGCENATVDGCENATVDGCENATVTVAEMQPNNVSNNSINVSNNSLNHGSNNLLNHGSNSLLMEEEKPLEKDNLYSFLIEKKVDELVAKSILSLSQENDIQLYDYEIVKQLKQMYYEINVENKFIADFAMYFINGIIMQRQQRKYDQHNEKMKKISKLKEAQKKKEPPPKVFLYNWLEENGK